MSLGEYRALVAQKAIAFEPRGFAPRAMHPSLKPHQAHCVDFAIRSGAAALFLDTGLGKTLCALDWGRAVVEHTNRPVLMLAPLAVAKQHEREAERWSIDARSIREPSEIAGPRIYITNYDRLHMFDASAFGGVILDESSILKSFTGATTRALMAAFAATPYRLACTATPAPNDHMELGQHSQFLGVMDSPEMLARWFTADQTQMGRYRLKKPAVTAFWDWVASWARCVSKPSDLGFDNAGYDLPPLDLRRHIVAADRSIEAGAEKDGQARLFRMPEMSATSIHREKRMSAADRADALAAVVATEPAEPWVLWCDTNYEADALTARIPDAVEVRGSMRNEVKEERLDAFATGRVRCLVSKPSICGFGLNWQHAARMGFVGLSFSYESFYQAVRRCWRFGQSRPVQVHVAMSDTEGAIWDAISRKSGDHGTMRKAMSAAMARSAKGARTLETYAPNRPMQRPAFLERVIT